MTWNYRVMKRVEHGEEIFESGGELLKILQSNEDNLGFMDYLAMRFMQRESVWKESELYCGGIQ